MTCSESGPEASNEPEGFLCDLCGGAFHAVLRTKRAEEWQDILRFRESRGLSTAGIPTEYTLVRCADCGLVSTHPQLDSATLRAFYDDYLSGMYDDVLNPYDEGFATERSIGYVLRIREKAGGGRLLDIGCATGALMSVAATYGFVPEGVEVSASAAARARRHGLVYQGDLLEIERAIPDESYDIVTSIDSLEHLAQPVTALRLMYRKLKRGGLIFIETPNEDAGFDEMSRHLHLFSVKTLRRALETARFSEIEIQPTDTRYNRSDRAAESRFIEAIARRVE